MVTPVPAPAGATAGAIGAEPAVSILVVTLRRTDLLAACLASVASSATKSPYEVVVVNNGGRARAEPVEQAVASVTAPHRVVHAPCNLGLAGGLRVARSHARGQILCTLQDDVVVEPGWLDALVGLLGHDPWVGVAGSLILDAAGTWGLGSCNEGWLWDGRGVARPRRPTDPSPAPVLADTTNSASMAVRAHVWDATGEPDFALYPVGCTDASVCLAAAQAGWAVVVEPRSRVRHTKGASTSASVMRLSYNRNRALVLGRYGGRVAGRPGWEDQGTAARIEAELAEEDARRRGAAPPRPVTDAVPRPPDQVLRDAVRAARSGRRRMRADACRFWGGACRAAIARRARRLVGRRAGVVP